MRPALCFALAAALAVSACVRGPSLAEGDIIPGGLMRGQAEGAQVFLNGGELDLTEQGFFAFGFGRDSGGKAFVLEARWPSGEIKREVFRPSQRDYIIQRIDGLPEAQVAPPPEVWPRLAAERAAKTQARERKISGSWFQESFLMPARGPISGTYGNQRILNGQKRRPHGGIDIAVSQGTPVRAPAGGVVVLAEKDFYFEGGLVFLSHGGGIMSAFLHLSQLAVAPAAQVARGDIIGYAGATGRATGPHLDWRLYWRAVALDPALAAEEQNR